MAEHPWQQIEIEDEGPMGLGGKFWHCPICGVGGGPAHSESMNQLLIAKGVRIRWRPFIVGHGRHVSEDCEEAQRQMREYAEEKVAHFRARWQSPRGEHSHYHSLFHDALRWNPTITNIHGLLDLMSDVESPSALCCYKRPSLVDCRFKLEEMGFDMSGGGLGKVILTIVDSGILRELHEAEET